MLMTLVFTITVGLANAQSIGTSPQVNPFEALPTVRTVSAAPPTVTQTSGASMMDGDLGTFGTVYAAGTTGTFYWLRFSGFGNAPPLGEFPITWVSLQIKYAHPLGMVDDQYKWEWSVDGVTWMQLTAPTNGKFDSAGAPQVRSFSQLAEPTDGTWDWADIGSIMVRYYVARGGTGFDGAGRPFRVYDLWISVYSSPVPPAGMSMQAPAITAQDAAYLDFFIEVYIADVIDLAGWEYNIYFDPAVLLPTEYYNYYPWTDIAAPDVGPDYIHIDGTIPVADPLVSTGLDGDLAVARIYFMINEDPDNLGFPMPPNFSWLRFTLSLVGDPEATKIPHSVYNGFYGTPPENSYVMGSSVPKGTPFPYGATIGTTWFEEYPFPEFGFEWQLTTWNDNGDTLLGFGDDLLLTHTTPPGPERGPFTPLQIWECDADPTTFVFMISLGPVPEFPLGVGLVLGLAPAILVIYIWRTRPRKRVPT